jgi:DNA-directed RNA polymerase subunit M/transcription elongation factor TFIIS
MAPTKSDSVVVSCPKCGAKLAVDLSLVGKRARCAGCNQAFIIAAAETNASSTTNESPKPAETDHQLPDYVGFDCRLCGARLFAEPKNVGKKQRCGECGTLMTIPPPAPPKKKNIPAAMEGEQYELWEPDEQPLPSEISEAEAKLIAVRCRRCDTIMYGTEKQVGEAILCPDCRTRNIVPPPPRPREKRSVLSPDALTPGLDPLAHPGERPATAVSDARMLHEVEQAAEYERALEKSRRTGKPMEIDIRGRPIMPRWPLIKGVLPFLFSSGVPVIWLALSVGYYAAGSVFLWGLRTAMMGGMAALAGMCLFAVGVVMTMVCSAAFFSVLMQIITESSEGNRRINQWPSFIDWFGSLLYFGTAIMMSAVPGAAIAQIPAIHEDPELSATAISVGVLIFLPIILLSQLHIGSPWAILSGRVLASLFKCPFSWAFFYFECALLDAICGAAVYFVADNDPNRALYFTPLFVAALMLWARLLGRLAWRLAEAMPLVEK